MSMENRTNLSGDTQADITVVDDRSAGEQRAAQGWAQLLKRVRSITPSALARFLLVIGALAAIVALVWSVRVTLAPFVAGLALAYVTAPLVSWFDRILPRSVSVLLVVFGELLLLVSAVVLLAPPLAQQLLLLTGALPTVEDLRQFVGRIGAYMATLPAPARALAQDTLNQATTDLRSNLLGYLQQLISIGVTNVLTLLNTFGFILSFLVIPTWLFAVLGDRNINARTLAQQLPPWLRGDLLAVVRIFDRTFRAFIGGQVLIALAVGLLTYGGAYLLNWQGWLDIKYPLALALLTGLLALIPAVGPPLTYVLVVLLGLLRSPLTAVLVVLLVFGVHQLVNWLVTPRVERGYTGNIHPALLILALVVVSQFGPFWLLLAAPITSSIVDLYRYVYGRFRDPPRPAGLLPGEPLPPEPATAPGPARRRGSRPTRARFGSDRTAQRQG
jgi:predicted PurR-regulated permease PerM